MIRLKKKVSGNIIDIELKEIKKYENYSLYQIYKITEKGKIPLYKECYNKDRRLLMEIFELEKERAKKRVSRQSKINNINLLREKLGIKATDYSSVKVKTMPKKNKELVVFAKIEEMEKDLYYIDKEIEQINNDINALYQIFKKYNDEEQQIYTEKKLYKWSNAKISVNHGGISKSQINRIVKKVKENS